MSERACTAGHIPWYRCASGIPTTRNSAISSPWNATSCRRDCSKKQQLVDVSPRHNESHNESQGTQVLAILSLFTLQCIHGPFERHRAASRVAAAQRRALRADRAPSWPKRGAAPPSLSTVSRHTNGDDDDAQTYAARERFLSWAYTIAGHHRTHQPSNPMLRLQLQAGAAPWHAWQAASTAVLMKMLRRRRESTLTLC